MPCDSTVRLTIYDIILCVRIGGDADTAFSASYLDDSILNERVTEGPADRDTYLALRAPATL